MKEIIPNWKRKKKLIDNNIKTPQIFENFEVVDKTKLPIFCKQNIHAGMVFKIYTVNTINKFFEKFDSDEFYLEEAIESNVESKFYFVKGNIYAKNNIEILNCVKKNMHKNFISIKIRCIFCRYDIKK